MTVARITTLLAGLALALGLGHMSFLLAGPPGWDLNRLWFAGTGLAFLLAALLNVIGRNAPGRSASGLAVTAANLIVAGFFATAWPLLKGPQVIVGGLLFAVLAVLTITRAPAVAATQRAAIQSSGPGAA